MQKTKNEVTVPIDKLKETFTEPFESNAGKAKIFDELHSKLEEDNPVSNRTRCC